MTIAKLDSPTNGAWKHDDPRTARTLPSRYFYDPEIFEREKRGIFYRCWHFAGHECEFAAVGDYVVTDILDQSVIVVRAQGGVRAFHNVCQHRGTRLLHDRRGRLGPVLTCPYHSWAYGLDGGLRSAPRSEGMKDFDKADHGLKSVRVERFAGCYFFNLDPDGPSVALDMAGADDEIRAYCPDLGSLRLIDEQEYRVAANWKVIVDNEIEGYHFPLSGPVHRELALIIDYERWDPTAHGKWWVFKSPPKPGVTNAYGERIGNVAHQTDWFFNIKLWPYNTFYVFPYADFLGTFLTMPVGPEESLIRCGYYRPDRPEPELTRAARAWFGGKLAPEDIRLNVGVQKGLKSFGFDQGRYIIDPARPNIGEHLVLHFHTLVHDAIQG